MRRNAYSNTYRYPKCHTHRNGYSDWDTNSDAYCPPYSYSYCHSHTYCKRYTYCDSNSDATGYPNA